MRAAKPDVKFTTIHHCSASSTQSTLHAMRPRWTWVDPGWQQGQHRHVHDQKSNAGESARPTFRDRPPVAAGSASMALDIRAKGLVGCWPCPSHPNPPARRPRRGDLPRRCCALLLWLPPLPCSGAADRAHCPLIVVLPCRPSSVAETAAVRCPKAPSISVPSVRTSRGRVHKARLFLTFYRAAAYLSLAL